MKKISPALASTAFASARRLAFALPLLLTIHRPALADFQTADAAEMRGEHSEAYRACKSAAEAGDAQCQNLVGYLYQQGSSVLGKDETEAVRWFRLAAKHGLAGAQCNLGLAYDRGRSIPRDQAEAVRWYQKAAAQRDPIGEYLFGYSLAEGEGVAKNRAWAIELLRDAAERGYTPAQIELALELERSWGPGRQPVEAYMWYRIAARTTGNERIRDLAIQGQNRLLVEFSSQQVINVRDAAEHWTPVGPRLEFGPLGVRPASSANKD
jgi:TPR repeat protein